jgi:hypothetical protein
MTRSLFRALTARLAVVALAGLLLGGLAVQAAATRPAPIVWNWELHAL